MDNEIREDIQTKKDKTEDKMPDDQELCKSMYSMLQDMDMRLKKLEEKLNRPLIG